MQGARTIYLSELRKLPMESIVSDGSIGSQVWYFDVSKCQFGTWSQWILRHGTLLNGDFKANVSAIEVSTWFGTRIVYRRAYPSRQAAILAYAENVAQLEPTGHIPGVVA